MAGLVAEGEQAQAAHMAPLNLGRAGPVRAGGGVVWKPGGDGRPVVILVHRPKYDDWTLPKGKVGRAEDEAHAALREVEEETGLRCRLGRELPGTSYRDHLGRAKTVRYWSMTPIGDRTTSFVPNAEVDEVRWLAVGDAARLLTYDRDREVLASFPEHE